MPSQASRVLLRAIKISTKIFGKLDVARQRSSQEMLDLIISQPKSVAYEPFEYNGLQMAWLRPSKRNRAGKVMLHLHGGSFISGGPRYCRAIAARLAAALGVDTLTIVYRLAPEHPYPAAVDDAMRAYEYLISRGYRPSDILIAGESAGGNLAAGLSVRLRDEKRQVAAGLYLLSPWVDLDAKNESHAIFAEADPSLQTSALLEAAALYANGLPLDDCRVSPLYANLSGLPKTLIQCGGLEILQGEARDICKRMRGQGVDAHYQRWDGMWHVFHAFDLPEARQALKKARIFFYGD